MRNDVGGKHGRQLGVQMKSARNELTTHPQDCALAN
jgi:hypothetical protein